MNATLYLQVMKTVSLTFVQHMDINSMKNVHVSVKKYTRKALPMSLQPLAHLTYSMAKPGTIFSSEIFLPLRKFQKLVLDTVKQEEFALKMLSEQFIYLV